MDAAVILTKGCAVDGTAREKQIRLSQPAYDGMSGRAVVGAVSGQERDGFVVYGSRSSGCGRQGATEISGMAGKPAKRLTGWPRRSTGCM